MKYKNIQINIYHFFSFYILLLSIFNVIKINVDSIIVSVIRILFFSLFFIFSFLNFLSSHKKISKDVFLILIYFMCELLTYFINGGNIYLTKKNLMFIIYPVLSILLFLVFNKDNYKNSIYNLLYFCKFITIFNLYACIYNLFVNFNQFYKLFNLKSSYDFNLTSFFDNRNVFGLFLVFGIIANVILIMLGKKSQLKVWVVSLTIILFNLIFTFSRASILCVLTFFVLLFIFNKNIRKKILSNKNYLFVLLGIILLVFLIPFTRNFVFDNIIRLDSGLTNRDKVFKYCFEYLLTNNWIFGNGFVKPYIEFNKQFNYIGFHSTYFTILICQGIVGFVFFVLLILFSINNSIKIKKNYNDKIGSICLAIIFSYLVYSFFESRILFNPEYLDLIVSIFVVLVPFYSLRYFQSKENNVEVDNFNIKSDILVSIIVPVFNIEKYLNRAVDSIINQSYKKLQIILVDDGSTDNSSSICDYYSKIDSRIKVIHKKNGGVSSARNTGLSVSKGKYIYFMDGDDWMDKNLIKTLLYLILFNNCDISAVSYYYSYDNFDVEINDSNKLFCYDKEESYNAVINGEVNGFLCNKLYKKSLIKKLGFDESIYYREDLVFNCEYLKNINKMVYKSVPYYYYYQRDGSALNTKKYNDKMISHIFALEKLITICKEQNINIEQKLQYRILKTCYNLKYRIKVSCKEDKKDTKKIIDSTIKKYYNKFIKNDNVSNLIKKEIIITNKFPVLIGAIKQMIVKMR